jgi:hypothetical protein
MEAIGHHCHWWTNVLDADGSPVVTGLGANLPVPYVYRPYRTGRMYRYRNTVRYRADLVRQVKTGMNR